MEVTRTGNSVDKVVRTCPHHLGTMMVSLPEPIQVLLDCLINVM